ncbi:hypothetical protein QUS87_22600, partial [Xanthomonas citri pv. citri]
SEQLCVDTVQPGQRGHLRSHEKGKVWERASSSHARFLFCRRELICAIRIGPSEKSPNSDFRVRPRQVAAGGIDLGPALLDARDDGGGHLAHVCLRRFPGTRLIPSVDRTTAAVARKSRRP